MKKVLLICFIFVCLSGCASLEIFDNKKEVGTLHGVLTGAAVGGIVASPTAIGIPVGAFVGGVTGLVVGDVFDKKDPRYYVDRSDKTKKDVIIKAGPFKMIDECDMWYIVYDKDGVPTIAQKELRGTFWQDLK